MTKYQVGDLVTLEYKGVITGIHKIANQVFYRIEFEPSNLMTTVTERAIESQIFPVPVPSDIIKGV